MLEDSIKKSRYHHMDPVLNFEYVSLSEKNIYLVRVRTLERPKDEIEFVKNPLENEMCFYQDKINDHYIISRNEIVHIPCENDKIKEKKILAICHESIEAKSRIWKEAREYIKDLSELLNIKDVYGNDHSTNKVKDILKNIESIKFK